MTHTILTVSAFSKTARADIDPPCNSIQLHIYPPARETRRLPWSMFTHEPIDTATVTRAAPQPEDATKDEESSSDDAKNAELKLLIAGIIDRVLGERGSKRLEESPKPPEDEPSPLPASSTLPESSAQSARMVEMQEVKRWRELLKLEDEVKKMAEQLTKRERAMEEKEQRLSALETAAKVETDSSPDGDEAEVRKDNKRSSIWKWW